MRPEADWNSDLTPAEGTQFDLKRIVLGRKWLLILCVALGVAGGHYQLSKQPEVYSSTGQILLKRTHQAISVEGLTTVAVKDPLEEHLELIRKGRIVEGAARRLLDSENPVASLVAYGEAPALAAAISRRLSVVRPNPKTDFVNITYTSGNQAECQPVVNAVIEAYEEYLTEDQQRSSSTMVSRVEEAQRVLDGDLRRKREEYRQFRARTSLVLNGNQGKNLHHERALGIEAERRLLLLRETEIKAELQAIESAKRRGTSLDVLRLLADQLSTKNASRTGSSAVASAGQSGLLGQLTPLYVEEALLKDKFGPNHPDVKAISKRIEVMKGLLSPTGESTASSPSDFLDLYVKALEEELRVVVEKGTRLTALYLQEQAAARSLGEEETLNAEMLDDIQRTQQLYDQIVQKLEQVNLVKSNDNYALERITPPGPGRISPPNPQQYYAMGGLAGLFAGMFLSFLLELSDRGFRSPAEINQFLNLPVIGHIPQISSERGSKIVKDKSLDPNLAVFQRPKSRVAEAFRGVRTALMFGLKDKTHSVIQVTSPDPSDGKSTLASNLAASLAASGKRVILIDCDLRKPKQHKLFSFDLSLGVTAVIAGQQTIEEATRETPVENLWVMTAGPRTDHPGELLLKPEFDQLLQTLKQKYDFVIVDTPPILPVTDSAVIGPKVDGVVVVFRVSKYSKPHATQAVQQLEMVDARVLGIVVNGVAESAGYSYGGGGYGYQYRYGGNYGRYEYRERENPREPRLEQRIAN
jgi:capsular exopolysaccharide synthesis family protein